MNYEAPFVIGILLVILALILRLTRSAARPDDHSPNGREASSFRRYVAFETEESALLVPALLVIGIAGVVIGGIGLLLT